jgi:hypothetical protein
VSTVTTFSADYAAVTTGCGLLDRSERGKLALTGAEAKEFLHGQVTNNIESLSSGEGCYAALLTNKGKMLADLRVEEGGGLVAGEQQLAGGGAVDQRGGADGGVVGAQDGVGGGHPSSIGGADRPSADSKVWMS